MSGQIRVTPAELSQTATEYGRESQEVITQIGRMDNLMGRLQGMWEGQASEAFKGQYDELKPSFQKMADLLQDIQSQLTSTANALEDADRQIAGQIRG
ncbi:MULTISPECIES: WXG100 family type VII secretion target [Bacillus]|uniref:WXG100 family type VII secretion target n=1 Tax=Bacillus TaxID=1386 RepID=UPI00031E8B13|nr:MULTISPECIES: WXG100 family type VII secretion target [Bacillus]